MTDFEKLMKELDGSLICSRRDFYELNLRLADCLENYSSLTPEQITEAQCKTVSMIIRALLLGMEI